MFRKLPALILVAMAFAAIVVGCGGGDDDSSGSDDSSSASSGPITTSSLSKAAFIKKVNALCDGYQDERRDKLFAYIDEKREGNGEASEDLLLESVKAVFVPSLEQEVDEIREIGAPKGDEDEIEKILVGFEKSADAADELESTKAKATVDRLFARAGVEASKYGVDECAVG